MEVILKENFPSLGYVGDRVAVKGGYARNFLIPRGIAVEASVRSEHLLRHKLQHIMAKRQRLRSEAEAIAKTLGGLLLEFTLKMSDGGKSFGSVTSRDIEQGLQAKGQAIDRRQIKMSDIIRKPGEYKVHVKLHAEVIAEVPVKVTAEVREAKPAADKAEAKKARGRGKRASKKEEGADTEAVETPVAEASADSDSE